MLALVQTTRAIDAAWNESALQARSAAAALGTNAQLPPAAASSVARMAFIGTVLGEQLPADSKPAALPQGTDPVAAITSAEQAFTAAVATAARQSLAVGETLSEASPKHDVEAFLAAQERIGDAMYAVKFAHRIAPPPEAPAAPAGNQRAAAEAIAAATQGTRPTA